MNRPTLEPLEDAHLYGWYPPNSGVEGDFQVPADLVEHYRQFRPDGYWGLICPACRCVFPPGLGETIWGQFRTHIKELDSKGCFFAQKASGGSK